MTKKVLAKKKSAPAPPVAEGLCPECGAGPWAPQPCHLVPPEWRGHMEDYVRTLPPREGGYRIIWHREAMAKKRRRDHFRSLALVPLSYETMCASFVVHHMPPGPMSVGDWGDLTRLASLAVYAAATRGARGIEFWAEEPLARLHAQGYTCEMLIDPA